MTTLQDEHKRTVQRYPNAVASGNLDVIDEICTEDVVSHAPLGEPRGREALKEYEAPIHDAFPNFDVTVKDSCEGRPRDITGVHQLVTAVRFLISKEPEDCDPVLRARKERDIVDG